MRAIVFLFAAAALAQPWENIFDGRTSAGWRTQSREVFPSSGWKIEDGAIHSVPTGGRADICTAAQYRNFELEFEWKLAPGVNSGVKYLVFGMRPNPATGRLDPDVPKALGFELQLIDDPTGKLKPAHSTGALYLFAPPHNVPRLEPDTWHGAKIRVSGRRIEHWLNGARVMEADLESPALRAAMERETRPDIPKPAHLDELRRNPAKAYPIVITHHGGDAWFRNLRIRRL
ncbi:MAG: DUF1080 domain-containing protein [Acidobacteria bacterium]|nr:DUF1080 domain-containing protein [Acidobacteriota bacterium]